MNTKYTKEQLELIIKENFSVAECLRKLGLRPAGGNYKYFNRLVEYFNLDTCHFTGQGWSVGKKISNSNRGISLDKILIENSTFVSSNHLRKKLLKEGIKLHKCEKCLHEVWNNLPIPLELEHCNGINTDNRIENLLLLCPNCHAQTDHYRGKNKLGYTYESREKRRIELDKIEILIKEEKVKIKSEQKKILPSLCECGNTKTKKAKLCRDCDYVERGSKIRPSIFQLMEDFKELKNFVQVGKKYGVSDNSVRKWLKVYKVSEESVKNSS